MVERARRGKGKQKLLGSHQKCWLWGRHAVLETLHAGRWLPIELHLSDSLANDIRTKTTLLAEKHHVAVEFKSATRLQQLCKSGEHQGFVAKMPEYPYDSVADILAEQPANAFFVILDGVQDPYNFGAILRSAEIFGVDAVFLRETGQVGVTSLVARTSAGAVNHVRIARTDDLAGLTDRLRKTGIAVVAADHRATATPSETALHQPTALLIGNEGHGVSDQMLERCDHRVAIPQDGRVGSLNAAVAAGILFYEVARQRTTASRSNNNSQP